MNEPTSLLELAKSPLFNAEILMHVLRKCPVGIVMVGSDGKIIDVNPKAVLMFQYAASELVGQGIETLVPQSVRERHLHHRAGFQDDPRERPMGEDQHLSARRKDGSTIPVKIDLAPIQTCDGLVTIAYVQRGEGEGDATPTSQP